MKELIEIRSKLSVPKTQWNDHSKFNYRSCEDILEALKPHLKKHECILTISDSLLNIGERYYVQSTAKIVNKNGAEVTASPSSLALAFIMAESTSESGVCVYVTCC